MEQNLYKRLSVLETAAARQKSQTVDVLMTSYENACQSGNADEAAECARMVRNRLLEISDNQMTLDRLGLETESVSDFVVSLLNIFSGAWAEYRKALRDLPDQEGFPFSIVFPTPPDQH